MKDAIEGRNAQLADAERKHALHANDLKSELDGALHQVEELAKQLEAQRMEFSMYQNSTKNKMSELQQHKKILKREVIDLRKRIDEAGCENTTVTHEHARIKSSHQSIKEKNATLERYIERLEKQVGVQQNMMEMMSQGGGGASLMGKFVGPGVANDNDVSKDAISLSGMSLGSQNYKRANSGASGVGGEARSMSYGSSRPRPLLPPESKGDRGSRNLQQQQQDAVSPLPTPKFQSRKKSPDGGAAAHEFDGEADDARDTSTTMQLDDSTGAENDNIVGDDDCAVMSSSSPKTKLSMDEKDDGGNSRNDFIDPILANRSAESGAGESGVTADRSEQQPAEASQIPMQVANSFVDEVINDVKNMPSLDSDAMRTLNVNATRSQSPAVDENNAMKKALVSLDDQLLSGAADLPPAAATKGSLGDLGGDDDDDDEGDNVSHVSDITEDRTQRQIDDDLAERRKILLAYVNSKNSSGGGGGSSISLSNASAKRQLETIESAMFPNSAESQDGTATSRSGSGRLSVAQRARLDAERRSNFHRSPTPSQRRKGIDGAGDSSSQQQQRLRGDSDSARSSDVTPPAEGRSGSFLKSLGKAIEKTLDNSVLGVHLDDEAESDFAESDFASSIVSDASVSFVLFLRKSSYHCVN